MINELYCCRLRYGCMNLVQLHQGLPTDIGMREARREVAMIQFANWTLSLLAAECASRV